MVVYRTVIGESGDEAKYIHNTAVYTISYGDSGLEKTAW